LDYIFTQTNSLGVLRVVSEDLTLIMKPKTKTKFINLPVSRGAGDPPEGVSRGAGDPPEGVSRGAGDPPEGVSKIFKLNSFPADCPFVT
jgi:hypothetical protein